MDNAEDKKEKCGRGREHMRMWVAPAYACGFYVGFEFVENGEVCCANPITFRTTAHYAEDNKTAMCMITDNMAVKLMDDLWKAGIRPTKWEPE